MDCSESNSFIFPKLKVSVCTYLSLRNMLLSEKLHCNTEHEIEIRSTKEAQISPSFIKTFHSIESDLVNILKMSLKMYFITPVQGLVRPKQIFSEVKMAQHQSH